MPVKVKICGITSCTDADAAVRLGAAALGLNFFTGSLRCVTHETAAEIARRLPLFVEPVALFVNETLEFALEQAARFPWLHTIQWHGELPDLTETAHYRFIVAHAVRNADSLRELDAYLNRCSVAERLPAALLLDAHVAGKFGGTGRTAPWELLRDFRPPVPVILAGGLTPDNVAEAIRIVQPYAVDVASGVESSPGRKDEEKMRRFIAAVRSVSS